MKRVHTSFLICFIITQVQLQKNNVNFILKQVEDITIQLGKREEELAQAMMKVKKIYIYSLLYDF